MTTQTFVSENLETWTGALIFLDYTDVCLPTLFTAGISVPDPICARYAMQRFQRLMRMIKLITQDRAPSVDDFCREFEKEKRTVYEDIRFLKENMFFPIKFDSARNGYVCTNPSQQLPEFDLDEGEILALMLGSDMLAEHSGTIFEPLLKSAIEKIQQRLSERVKGNVDDLSVIVKFIHNGTARSSRRMFSDLQKACSEKFTVHIIHFAPHSEDTTMRRVDPYRLVESRGAWYLVGWCQLRNAMRTFALHRISELKILPDTFEIRPEVDIEKWLESAFQLEHGDPELEYVIQFDSKSAHYVRERQWHASQKIVENEGGGCTISFRATRVDEVKRWVLPYGAAAEVLEPVQLRAELATEFREAAAKYNHLSLARTPDIKTSAKIAAQEKKPAGPKIGTAKPDNGKSKKKGKTT